MLKRGGFAAVAVAALFAFSSHANAATGINQQLSFEGKIVDSSGQNILDGTYNVEFKIYQDGNSSGSGSTLKWTEDRLKTSGNGVTFTSGTFQVNLGSVNPFGSSVDWNQDTLWLSLNIGSTNATCTPFSSCTPDGEMTPFIRLTATPYAMNADKLDGIDSSGFVQLNGSQSGNINIGSGTITSGAINGINIGSTIQPSSSGALTVQSNGANALAIDAGGSAAVNIASTNATSIVTGGNTSATITDKIANSSTTAYTLQTAGGTALLIADTTNSRITVGASDTTGTLFIFDTKTGSGDPTGVNGGEYYNSNAGKFRCYENSTWKNCVTTNAVGLVAVLSGSTAAIANTETQVVGYTIPANTSAVGDTYRITAYYTRGGGNTTAPTFRIRVGSNSLTGNVAATITGAAAVTTPGAITALVTIQSTGASGTIGGGMTHTVTGTATTVSNTAAVTMDTTAAKIIELTTISGQTNANETFTYATIEKLSNQ